MKPPNCKALGGLAFGTEEKPVLETYANEQYRKLLKEKDQYISLDDYCSQRGIEWICKPGPARDRIRSDLNSHHIIKYKSDRLSLHYTKWIYIYKM